jgi:hypothetical protein
MNDLIFSALEKAEKTFCLYMRSGLSLDALKKIIDAQEKGVQIEILVEEENSQYLRQDPFLYQLCSRMLNLGGAILQVNCLEPVNAFFLTDYKRISFVSPSSTQTDFNEVQHRDYLIKTRRYVQALKQKGSPLLKETSDIQVNIEVVPDFVKSGDPVVVSWNVKGASEVTLEGLGKVEARGSHSFIFFENTIVKVIAQNQRQVQYGTAYVRVYGDIEIGYDLGFLNPVTQQYSSLVNAENYPDVFGIMNGHSVQFSWEVNEADKVLVMPFNRTERKGELQFTPDSSFDIEIEASGNGQVAKRIIHIQLFPVPLFKEKMNVVQPKWFQRELKVSLPDQASRLSQKDIQSIMQDSNYRYEQMIQQLEEFSLKTNAQISPEIIRALMLPEIKRRFSLKEEVSHYIEDFYRQLTGLKFR